jgi:hypothetical protein
MAVHTAVEQKIVAFVVESYACLFCDLTSGKHDNSCVAVLREILTKTIAALRELLYSKTCLKWNAIVPVFFSVLTGFRFTKGCVLIKQSTKNMIA